MPILHPPDHHWALAAKRLARAASRWHWPLWALATKRPHGQQERRPARGWRQERLLHRGRAHRQAKLRLWQDCLAALSLHSEGAATRTVPWSSWKPNKTKRLQLQRWARGQECLGASGDSSHEVSRKQPAIALVYLDSAGKGCNTGPNLF